MEEISETDTSETDYEYTTSYHPQRIIIGNDNLQVELQMELTITTNTTRKLKVKSGINPDQVVVTRQRKRAGVPVRGPNSKRAHMTRNVEVQTEEIDTEPSPGPSTHDTTFTVRNGTQGEDIETICVNVNEAETQTQPSENERQNHQNPRQKKPESVVTVNFDELETQPSENVRQNDQNPRQNDTESVVTGSVQASSPLPGTSNVGNAANNTAIQVSGAEDTSTEIPLDILKRTKAKTDSTEKKNKKRQQWNSRETMKKIKDMIIQKKGPVNIDTLLASEPQVPGQNMYVLRRKCFESIIRLKQQGFIKTTRDPQSREIVDIELGKKFE